MGHQEQERRSQGHYSTSREQSEVTRGTFPPSLRPRGTLGTCPPLPGQGSTPHSFASCSGATQTHRNNRVRRNKSCQCYRTTCKAACAFTRATYPHHSHRDPKMLHILCPPGQNLMPVPSGGCAHHGPRAAVTSAEAPQSPPPKPHGQQPPKGLRRAGLACWSSLGARGASSSPAQSWREATSSSPELGANTP